MYEDKEIKRNNKTDEIIYTDVQDKVNNPALEI